MYDRQTEDLIRATPLLDGLNRDSLPDELSQSFAEIAAARLRVREIGEGDNNVLTEIIARMQKLVFTNEALVSIAPQRSDRAAAAFVAGSAHQLCFNARRITGAEIGVTYLGAESISSDIAAMLLFLVAEATADSSEVAARVRAGDNGELLRTVIESLKALALGHLSAITDAALLPPAVVEAGSAPETAMNALYYQILRGVRVLALELSGVNEPEDAQAIEIFRRVQVLSSSSSVGDAADWLSGEIGAFAGPHHLASLLIAVAGDLAEGAVVAIEPPGGVDPTQWRASLKRFTQSRPYLWRNHREAILEGYLEPRTSSAISFPTGAGKSRLAELKITATLLLGKKVVFLAPTNALVDQTTRSLQRAFPSSKVA